MNDKTAKSFKSFIKRFIYGSMKQKRHSFQFRNEQLLLHFRLNGEIPACTLRRCFSNYQRCSSRFRNEQLRIFDSARARGRTFGIHDYAMPPRHRVLAPFSRPCGVEHFFTCEGAPATLFSKGPLARRRVCHYLRECPLAEGCILLICQYPARKTSVRPLKLRA